MKWMLYLCYFSHLEIFILVFIALKHWNFLRLGIPLPLVLLIFFIEVLFLILLHLLHWSPLGRCSPGLLIYGDLGFFCPRFRKLIIFFIEWDLVTYYILIFFLYNLFIYFFFINFYYLI